MVQTPKAKHVVGFHYDGLISECFRPFFAKVQTLCQSITIGPQNTTSLLCLCYIPQLNHQG
jgi:hypothetical protein